MNSRIKSANQNSPEDDWSFKKNYYIRKRLYESNIEKIFPYFFGREWREELEERNKETEKVDEKKKI